MNPATTANTLEPVRITPAARSPRVHTVIRPSKGWSSVNAAEIWQFRDLLTTLAIRDVRLRYRQTALGALWVIIQPLIAAAVFTFVFGRVAHLQSDGVPYMLFAYAGLLGWNAFNATLTKSSTSLINNTHLVAKVYFPRLILPLSTVFSALIDFAVALVMMAILMCIYHFRPGPWAWLMPVWLLFLLMLAMALGLLASALMVSYRDVGLMLPVITQFLMYGSPIAYSVSAVPLRLQKYYFINPLSGLLEAFRWSLLGRGSIHTGWLAYSMVVSLLLFAAGVVTFRRMERRFADVI